eukprot:gene9998-20797_t
MRQSVFIGITSSSTKNSLTKLLPIHPVLRELRGLQCNIREIPIIFSDTYESQLDIPSTSTSTASVIPSSDSLYVEPIFPNRDILILGTYWLNKLSKSNNPPKPQPASPFKSQQNKLQSFLHSTEQNHGTPQTTNEIFLAVSHCIIRISGFAFFLLCF